MEISSKSVFTFLRKQRITVSVFISDFVHVPIVFDFDCCNRNQLLCFWRYSDAVFSMMTAFQREIFHNTTGALLNIGRAAMPAIGRLDSSIWNRLNEIGICASKTVRGCRAGIHKQRKISVIITERPYYKCVENVRTIDTTYLRTVPQNIKGGACSAPEKKSLPSLFVCKKKKYITMTEFRRLRLRTQQPGTGKYG